MLSDRDTHRSLPRLRTEFGPLLVESDASVLEPRTWTFEQSTWAADLARAAPSGPILELYCGAGHIGLAAALLCGRAIVQVDDSPAACAWTGRNAELHSIETDVRCASVDRAVRVGERFALVIADPPYVPSSDVDRYPDDPTHAIDGGADGLVEVARALRVMAEHLADGGVALLQVRGAAQSAEIADVLAHLDLPLAIGETRAITPERAITLLRRTRCERGSAHR